MKFFPRIALVLFVSAWPLVNAGAQQLDCQPCNDHYGRVQIGTSVKRQIQLKNVGTKSLRIKTAAITGAAFSLGTFPLPVDLGPGKTIKMPIVFAPTVKGKNTGTITLTSTAKNPKFVINVTGVGVDSDKLHLVANPTALDFGSVNLGSSASLSITLSAMGGPVKVSAIQSNSAAFKVPGLKLPLDVLVGDSVQVTVKFKPNASGTASGTLTVTSNADNSPTTVSLTGVGVQGDKPHLVANPTALDFGSVNVGSSASLSITLSATVEPVTVSAIQSNSAEFKVPGLNLPLDIPVGDSVQVTVKFKPTASGTASGTLTVTSNADNSPTSVSMTGVGVVDNGSHSADLSWDPSKDPVIGYNVYRGGTKGGPYSQLNDVVNASTDYTDSTVKSGSIYYYVVTAVNAENQESMPSNEAKVVIPSP